MHDNRVTEMVELSPITSPLAKRQSAKAERQLHAEKDRSKKRQRAARSATQAGQVRPAGLFKCTDAGCATTAAARSCRRLRTLTSGSTSAIVPMGRLSQKLPQPL